MGRFLEDSEQQFQHELSSFTKTLIYSLAVVVLLIALFCMLSIFRISSFAFQTYDSYKNIPFNKVGLLLGTSSNVGPGQDNHYFTYRIMAATELYNAGRIEYILVSGDNRHDSYNEPRMMYRALVKNGIPPDKIVMDFAGINTLNSVVRASQVFMLPNMTIISQAFHNERALFIAHHFGIKAIAYNAAEPDSGWNRLKVDLREIAARIKCILDVYFLGTQPKFLGSPIRIGDVMMPKDPSNKPRRPTSKPKRPGLSIQGLIATGRTVPKLGLKPKPFTAYTPYRPEEEDEDLTVTKVQEQSFPAEEETAFEEQKPAGEQSAPLPPPPPEQVRAAAEPPQVRAELPAAAVQAAEATPTAVEERVSNRTAREPLPPEAAPLEGELTERHQVPLTPEQLDNLQQQEQLLRSERTKALADAVEAASESLNTGTPSTYIDPNIVENEEMLEQTPAGDGD